MNDVEYLQLAARINDLTIAAFRRRMHIGGTDPAASGMSYRPEDREVAEILKRELS